MNGLQIFKNPEFGEVRTIEEDGRVLFCGSDAAKALGYAKPQNAVRDHCKGALKRGTLTDGGNQELLFIPEGDIYRLVIKSKLPSAEKFERWVFDEVLPSLRKKGSYTVPKMTPNELIAQLALANVEVENRLNAVERRVSESSRKIENTLRAFTQSDAGFWKSDMDRIIHEFAAAYGLNEVSFRGALYAEAEEGGINLAVRLKKLKNRLKQQGTTYKERQALTKLDVISRDRRLRFVFEGIIGRYQYMQSRYAQNSK
jgi:prophage antirepressor-like protein